MPVIATCHHLGALSRLCFFFAGQEDVSFEGTGSTEYLPDKLNQDRQPWPNPTLHRQVVNAALSGARAMAAHGNGTLSAVSFLSQILRHLSLPVFMSLKHSIEGP